MMEGRVNLMESIFEGAYRVEPDDREPFGDSWLGPGKYEHFKEHLIAVYKSDENDDGQRVEVYAQAAPARFWRIKVLADVNTVGEPSEPWELSTGSGGRELATWVHQTAQTIAEGMLTHKTENYVD